jgi:hypothetical protein
MDVGLGAAATVKGGNGVRVIDVWPDPLRKPFSLATTRIRVDTVELTRGAVKLE